MSVGRSVVGALFVIGGLALVGLSVFYMTLESEDVGRFPFLILGAIGAAMGLALAGTGILMIVGKRQAGSQMLLVIALVAVGLVLLSLSGLVLFAVIPAAIALAVVARALLASDSQKRVA